MVVSPCSLNGEGNMRSFVFVRAVNAQAFGPICQNWSRLVGISDLSCHQWNQGKVSDWSCQWWKHCCLSLCSMRRRFLAHFHPCSELAHKFCVSCFNKCTRYCHRVLVSCLRCSDPRPVSCFLISSQWQYHCHGAWSWDWRQSHVSGDGAWSRQAQLAKLENIGEKILHCWDLQETLPMADWCRYDFVVGQNVARERHHLWFQTEVGNEGAMRQSYPEVGWRISRLSQTETDLWNGVQAEIKKAPWLTFWLCTRTPVLFLLSAGCVIEMPILSSNYFLLAVTGELQFLSCWCGCLAGCELSLRFQITCAVLFEKEIHLRQIRILTWREAETPNHSP